MSLGKKIFIGAMMVVGAFAIIAWIDPRIANDIINGVVGAVEWLAEKAREMNQGAS